MMRQKKKATNRPTTGHEPARASSCKRRKAFSVLLVAVLVFSGFGIISFPNAAEAEVITPAVPITPGWSGTPFVPNDMAWDSTGSHAIVVGNDTSEQSNIWYHNVIGSWTKVIEMGSGTQTDPYLIHDVNELQAMRINIAAYYALANDIDANATVGWNAGAGFTPVGDGAMRFTGGFDGRGYSIFGLYVNRPAALYNGLFGYLDPTGKVSNVGLINVNITGSSTTGGIIGYNNVGTVNNSFATGKVSSTSSFIGGLVGYNGGLINNSWANANVTGAGSVGGLVGRTFGTIYNSFSKGRVIGTSSTGGLVGDLTSVGKVINSYSTGIVSGTMYVGGMAGVNLGAVSYSHATGFTSGSSSSIGGLIGQNKWYVNYSFATGNATGPSSVGGLVGLNEDGIVYGSYATGKVTATALTSYAGGLVGTHQYVSKLTLINNSFSTGPVNGLNYVGGLAGFVTNGAQVNRAYSSGMVNGSSYTGGFAGRIYATSKVYNSYSTSSVRGSNSYIAGFVGLLDTSTDIVAPEIVNCYSTGNVTRTAGTALSSAGFVGYNYRGKIINCYSTGRVMYQFPYPHPIDRGFVAVVDTGGMFGMTGNYWDNQTSMQTTNSVGWATGMNRIAMMTQTTYTGWDFTNVWWMVSAQTRPFLRSEWSTVIRNSHQLQMISMALTASYTLDCDIDLSDVKQSSQMWGTNTTVGTGFWRIGTSSGSSFTGTLQGYGYKINSLYINSPSVSYVGLFGYIGVAGKVYNFTLKNAYVVGSLSVGGLVGGNNGLVQGISMSGTVIGYNFNIGGVVGYNLVAGAVISKCSSSANVTSLANNAGGIVGYCLGTVTESFSTGIITAVNYAGGLGAYMNGATLANCYATGSASATTNNAGGLVAFIASGSILNSYSTGQVTAPSNRGGLIGSNSVSTVTSSFWDLETSGVATSAGGVGKTTAEMKTQATFVGWNFDTIWQMVPGITYPYFRKPTQATEEEESESAYQAFTGVAWENTHNRFWVCGEYRPGATSSVYYIDSTDYTTKIPVSGTPALSFKAIAADNLGNILVGGNGINGLHYYNGLGWTEVKNGTSMAGWNITGITFNTNDQRFYVVGNNRSQPNAVAFFTAKVPLTAGAKVTKDTSPFLTSHSLRSVAWNLKSSKNYSIAVGDGVYRMAYNGTGNSLNWSVINAPQPGITTYHDVSWDAWGNVTELIPAWDQACIVGGKLNITDGFNHGTFWRYYDSSQFFGVRHTDPNPGNYTTSSIKPPASPLYLYTFPDSGGGWEIIIDSSYEGSDVTLSLNKPTIFSVQMYKSSDVTQSNLLNRPVDANSTYTFLIEYNYVVVGADCWEDSSIALMAWFDEGNIGENSAPENSWATANNRTRQFCLNYSMSTKISDSYYPQQQNGQSEFFINNVWEDPLVYSITEFRHRVMINVTFGPQTYAANGAMTPAINTWDKNLAFNDQNTWDLCVYIHDPLKTDAYNCSYDEFGVKEYASIYSIGNPSGSAPPGSVNQKLSNPYSIYYSINTAYVINISITDLYLNGNEWETNKIPANNLTIRNHHTLAAGNSEVYVMKSFTGPNSALYIWNASLWMPLSAPLNGTQSAGPGYSDYTVGFNLDNFEVTEVEWWVSVPAGLPEGIYRASITLTIGD